MSCWYNNYAPEGDIVVSTRIRLARNINGYPFPASMTDEQKKEVNCKIKNTIENSNSDTAKGLKYIDMLGKQASGVISKSMSTILPLKQIDCL